MLDHAIHQFNEFERHHLRDGAGRRKETAKRLGVTFEGFSSGVRAIERAASCEKFWSAASFPAIEKRLNNLAGGTSS
jgi:hypothetical protein